MEKRKQIKDIFKFTNPIKWSKNTIILLVGLFYIFGQVYELEYRTKEIKVNNSGSSLHDLIGNPLPFILSGITTSLAQKYDSKNIYKMT